MTGDLEIKLRQIYFDRIERSGVANMLDSIYKHVTLLEDMQFLIKYSTTVLPPSPSDDAGEVVWENILSLQNELTGDDPFGLLYVIIYPHFADHKPRRMKDNPPNPLLRTQRFLGFYVQPISYHTISLSYYPNPISLTTLWSIVPVLYCILPNPTQTLSLSFSTL